MEAPPTPPVTLGRLLADGELGLRRLAGPAEAEVHGVHASEMADPSPYLLGGELLLTAGADLAGAGLAGAGLAGAGLAGAETAPDGGLPHGGSPAGVTDAGLYVERLVRAGAAAVGFGVTPVHASVPQALIDACAHHGLPLVEVPPATPFTAVGRAVWRLMAQARTRELRRVTEAQQSLAAAAARPDPVPAVLSRLAAALGGWAGLLEPVARTGAGAGPASGSAAGAGTTAGGGMATGQSTAPGPRTGTDASTGTGVRTGRGTGARASTDTGAGTGRGAAPSPVTGRGTGTGPGTGTGTGRGAGTGTGTGRGAGTGGGGPLGAGTGMGGGAGTGGGGPLGAGTGMGGGAGTGTGTGRAKGPGTGPGTGMGTGPATGAGTDTSAGAAFRPAWAAAAGAEPGPEVRTALGALAQRVAPGSATTATDTLAGTHLAAYAVGGGRVLTLATAARAPGDHTIASVAAVLLTLLSASRPAGTEAAALTRLLLDKDPADALGPGPWHVVSARGSGDPQALAAALGTVLLDARGDGVRLLTDREPAPQPGWTLGVSAPAAPGGLETAAAQAQRALDRAEAARTPLVRHTGGGLDSLLDPAEALAHAEALLAPLGAAHRETLRAWLAHHGSWDRTAAALAVHRNTVRQRIARAAALLGRDLDDPDTRMELWFALRRLPGAEER